MNQRDKTHRLRRLLLRWYRTHKRQLPWRRTRNPYCILLSEIMLQQTQVSRVQLHYPAFLRKFPALSKLARASSPAVIGAWRGMGYNTRAVRLKDFAIRVVKRFNGKIPASVHILRTLPGIGRYTANALACFAFGARVPVVDTNVRRVLSRVFFPMRYSADRAGEGSTWLLAERLLPRRRAADWNQALMDLGAAVCTAWKPSCNACPVSTVCVSRKTLRLNRRGEQARRREKLYGGLPVRIYRGRIIEQLRSTSGTIELGKLGGLVKTDFSGQELPWLSSVLQKLQRDRLVELRFRATKTYARLPQT